MTSLANNSENYQTLVQSRSDDVQLLHDGRKRREKWISHDIYKSKCSLSCRMLLNVNFKFKLLADHGEFAIEHSPGRSISCDGLIVCREKKYGNTAVTFFTTEASPLASDSGEV